MDRRVVVDGAIKVDVRADGKEDRVVFGVLELLGGLAFRVALDGLAVALLEVEVIFEVAVVRVAATLKLSFVFYGQKARWSKAEKGPFSIHITSAQDFGHD